MKKEIQVIALAGMIFCSCGTGKKLDAANQQIQSLNAQIAGLNKQVADGQQSIDQLKTENIQYSKEAEDCRKAKEAAAQRFENLNKELQANGTSMKQIKEKIAMALDRFRDEGIEVAYKNGLVYISMEDKLMFASGSTKVQDGGRQALSVVADVMDEFKHINVYVVGNTDTVTIKKNFKDNWSLSTERANTIVRILRDNYGADPKRLIAAGRGKYDPVADNATEEGRARNRRTDVVLNPDLSRLWGMMENKQ